MMFFKRNKETPDEKAARLDRIHTEMEQFAIRERINTIKWLQRF